MGLNDQREKIEYAWEQLEKAPFDSEHYQAAYEFLDNICLRTVDSAMWRKLLMLDHLRWCQWYEALGGEYQSDLDDTYPQW